MADNREEPSPQRGGTPSGSVPAAAVPGGSLQNNGSEPRRQQAAARGGLSPWLVITGALALLGAVGAALLLHPNQSSEEPPVDPSDFASRAERILRTTPLIDGHNDLPYLLRLELQNKIYDNEAFTFRQSKASIRN